MPIGFDLTQFAPPQRVQAPQRREAPAPTPEPSVQSPVPNNPNNPQNIEEALNKPLDGMNTTGMVDEEGHSYQDNLGRKNPALKKSIWQIDKFAAPVRPIQTEVIDKDTKIKKVIWIDANGNVPLDPETGEILIRSSQLPREVK
jgi:acyl-CoA thioesterase